LVRASVSLNSFLIRDHGVFSPLFMMYHGNFSLSIVTPRRRVQLEEDPIVAHLIVFSQCTAKVDPETRSKSTFISSMLTMSLALYLPALSPAFTKSAYPALMSSFYLIFCAMLVMRRRKATYLHKCPIDSTVNGAGRQVLGSAVHSPYLSSKHIQSDNAIVVPQFPVHCQHLIQSLSVCLGSSSIMNFLLVQKGMS
jgi:hypothetical protein